MGTYFNGKKKTKRGFKMKCPDCENKTRVKLTVNEDSFVIVRQHECRNCGRVFMTIEERLQKRLAQ